MTATNALGAHGTGQTVVFLVEESVGAARLRCLAHGVGECDKVISGRSGGKRIGLDPHDLPAAGSRQSIAVHLAHVVGVGFGRR